MVMETGLGDRSRLFLMTNERNTPKSDLWREIVYLINGFGNNYTHPTGLTVNECLAESNDLARMVNSGYGADPNETQEDRNNELEGCVTQQDLDIILEFQNDLSEKVDEFKKLFGRE